MSENNTTEDKVDIPNMVLSKPELDSLTINAEKVKNKEKDKTIIELKNQLLNVQESLLDAQKEVIKRDRMILEYHTLQVDNNIKVMKEENRDNLVNISRNRKHLKDKKWSYNPNTGEIIINEDS